MRRLPRVSRLVLPLLTSIVLLSCSGEADKPLAQYQGDGFTVLMPGKPTKSEQTADNPNGKVTVVLYTSESRNKAYLVGHTDVPEGVQIDLAGAIQGAASAVKGTATDEVETTFQGFPARDARITNASDGKGNKGTAFFRVIDAKTRLYQLQYIQEGGDVKAAPPEYTEFLNSLKIG
jgi:hypothetical protein